MSIKFIEKDKRIINSQGWDSRLVQGVACVVAVIQMVAPRRPSTWNELSVCVLCMCGGGLPLTAMDTMMGGWWVGVGNSHLVQMH